jgi:bifunctional pyridoxal-dependent enzyme with beta-cystathionase and maltose regulon repressor activities
MSVLENTGQTETKVPNTLAIVAAQAAVEQAKKYQEQIRESLERERAAERARAHESARKSDDAVQVSISDGSAPAATPAPATQVNAAPQASRGAAVDLNA